MNKKRKCRLSLLLCFVLVFFDILPGQGVVLEQILGTSLYVEAAAEESSSSSGSDSSGSGSVVAVGDEEDAGNIHWCVLSNYQLEISGSGAIPEGAFSKEWNGDKFSTIKSIYIKKEITEIGEKAFYCLGNNLTTVNFESGSKCTKIGNRAFYGSAIESLNLPNGLVEIGSLAFYQNKKLKSVTIPASLETFGTNVFAGAISLESVVFEEGSKCKVFPQGTFSQCPIKTLVWPSELEEIKDQAFAYCKFSTYENRIIIPKSVKKIGEIAFAVAYDPVIIELAEGSELKPTPIWGDIHHDGMIEVEAPNEVIVHNAGGRVYHLGSGAFTAAGEGDAVTVSCAACDYSTTLKLDVNNMTYYSGKEVTASYDGKDQWEEVIGKDVIAKDPNLAIPTITYEKKTDTGWSSISSAPKDAGTYRATATIKYTKGHINNNKLKYIEIPFTKEFTITPASIKSVAFTDPGAAAGGKPAAAKDLAVKSTEPYTASAISWTPTAVKFEYNKVYTAEITLTAKSNYVFASNVSIPSGWKKASKSNQEKLVLTRTYTTTSKINTQTEASAKISLNSKLKVSQTNRKLLIRWGSVSEATSYEVYANYSSKKECKLIKKVTGTSLTVKKLNGKALNTKKHYKVYILAKNGQKTIAKSLVIYAAGEKDKAYTNAAKVKITSKTAITLKLNKTSVIKAKLVACRKNKKMVSHAAKLRYASSNPKIATVSKKGVIKAIARGSCWIYVYANNGVSSKVKVTVK